MQITTLPWFGPRGWRLRTWQCAKCESRWELLLTRQFPERNNWNPEHKCERKVMPNSKLPRRLPEPLDDEQGYEVVEDEDMPDAEEEVNASVVQHPASKRRPQKIGKTVTNGEEGETISVEATGSFPTIRVQTRFARTVQPAQYQSAVA